MRTFISGLCVLMLSSILSAASYTVDQGGSGDYTTISGAAAVAVDGDTIIVNDGNYIESVTLTSAVALLAAGGASPSIQYDGTGTVSGAVLQVTDTDDTLIVDGFTINGINGADTVANGVYFGQYGTVDGYKVFRNLVIAGHSASGMNLQQNQRYAVEDCDISGGTYGIYTRISGASTISGCKVYDVGTGGWDNSAVMMYTASNITISGNAFFNCNRYGILARSTNNVTISNNLIFDNNTHGVHEHTGNTGFVVSGNTVYGNNRGLNLIADTLKVVQNNILWGNTADLYADAAGFGAGNVDNNCFATVTNVDTTGTSYVTGDPLFVNTTPGSYDFTLQGGSPCLGAGTGGIDLGAYGGAAPNTLAAPLPVTLASFYAQASACAVNLYWTTASECDNLGFNVLHCLTEDGTYEKVNASLVPGAGTSAGSNSYMFSHGDACEGISYYRLEQVDLNGTRTLSDPIAVTVQPTALADLAPVRIARQFSIMNPSDINNMAVSFPEGIRAKVSLYGTDGTCHGVMADGHFAAGVSSLRMPTAVQGGLYIVTIETKYGSVIKKVSVR